MALSRYSIKVYGDSVIEDMNIGGKLLDSGCFVRVYNEGTNTESTLFRDKTLTSKDSWITRSEFATDGGIEFYSESAALTVNVADSSGNIGSFLVTPNTRVIKLNQSSAFKTMCVHFTYEDSSDGSEVDTGLKFPPGAQIMGAYHYGRTPDAGISIVVGLLSTESGGDANGFIASRGVTSGSAGYGFNINFTSGSNERYLSQMLLGAFLDDNFDTGTDVLGNTGTYQQNGYMINTVTSKTISYTLTTGADSAEGMVFLPFIQTL